MDDGPVKSVKNFQQVEKWKQLMEILQKKKKFKSTQNSNSDTEPPVHGQYMWMLCWFVYVICLKTKEDLTLRMIPHKYICPNAYLFKS